jgi:hypothetical protein
MKTLNTTEMRSVNGGKVYTGDQAVTESGNQQWLKNYKYKAYCVHGRTALGTNKYSEYKSFVFLHSFCF